MIRWIIIANLTEYETLVLLLIRAQRQRNFNLYVEALEELTPLIFFFPWPCELRTVDPIDIRDMKSLPNSIAHEFQSEGHWVVSNTGNRFSAIPFDQAHEQENKVVKSAGSAVGLTENPVAFRRI